MGNRGILHDDRKQIVRDWQHKSWVTCRLEYKDRKRELFSPNNYSELFFLDEATAFAAGHRPCGECRRQRFNEFKNAWLRANSDILDSTKPSIGSIDRVMHLQRTDRMRGKALLKASINSLPNGTMIDYRGQAHLIWNHELLPWTHSGYSAEAIDVDWSISCEVLTPESIVRTFSDGFVTEIHPTALGD